MSRPTRLLILGGTGEATALARAIIDRFGDRVIVTSSLAGRTDDPAPVAGTVRTGGFGGTEGLCRYLRESGTEILIDATHPFAARISGNAATAAAALGLPLLRLERPPWQPREGDRWIEVADTREAAEALATLARRIWLTIGTTGLAPFAEIPDAWFLVRTIAAPPEPLPLTRYALLLGRGPFSQATERAVIAQHRLEALVTKASGGDATAAKLTAAREASIPVVMIRRPMLPVAETADGLDNVLLWLRGRIQGSD
jgi:precorrin-6A/cobalt-precorrin-6A reductase